MSVLTESTAQLHPAFSGSDRCIVFATNAAYMPLTSVALKSIIDTRDIGQTYDIIILHRDVEQAMQDTIHAMARAAENVSIRFFNMDRFTKGTSFYVDNRPSLSAEAYFRLYIPWLLSKAYRTALYLDGDMLVTRNINDIFAHNLSGFQIAGVRDYWGIIYAYMPNHPRKIYRAGIGLTDYDNYIISSTILFNLDYFRTCHTLQEVEKLIQTRKWVQHDQELLMFCVKVQYSISALNGVWSKILGTPTTFLIIYWNTLHLFLLSPPLHTMPETGSLIYMRIFCCVTAFGKQQSGLLFSASFWRRLRNLD